MIIRHQAGLRARRIIHVRLNLTGRAHRIPDVHLGQLSVEKVASAGRTLHADQ